jgi:transposase-like protein
MENKQACPRCGSVDRQVKAGFNESGSQKYRCNICRCDYTPIPNKKGYSDESKELALKMLVNGSTGRGVGKVLGMSKSNAYRWSRELAKKGDHPSG